MLTNALLSYGIASLVGILGFTICVFVLKKQKLKFKILHFLLGLVFILAALIAVLQIFKLAFASDVELSSNISLSYRVTVFTIIILATSLIRYLIARFGYFKEQRYDKGSSFIFGFGAGIAGAVTFYNIFLFIYVGITSATSRFIEYRTENNMLAFENGTEIPVFEPVWSHISITVISVLFMFLQICLIIYFLKTHTKNVKWYFSLLLYLVISILEAVLLNLLMFGIQYIAHWQIALVFAVILGICCAGVFLLPIAKEEPPYTKQFE
jgi:membrane protein